MQHGARGWGAPGSWPEPTVAVSAVPSTPVLVGSRAALMAPRWTLCPFQGGRPRGQLGRFHHSDSFRVSSEAFPLWS